MNVRARLVIFFLAASLQPVGAGDMLPKSPSVQIPETLAPDKRESISQEQRTLESFGIQNRTCLEWSDGCAVCMRQAGDKFACSLPGIACEPGGLACRREDKRAPEPETGDK